MPNAAVAEALAALPENRGVEIVAGRRVLMPACMPDASLSEPSSYWQVAGRSCPYIDPDPRNDLVLRLVYNALPEHTRNLTPALAEASLSDVSDEERREILWRVSNTLRSQPVMNRLYPPMEDK